MTILKITLCCRPFRVLWGSGSLLCKEKSRFGTFSGVCVCVSKLHVGIVLNSKVLHKVLTNKTGIFHKIVIIQPLLKSGSDR